MLKRISTDQLELGMHIKEFCGSWMDHPFWRTGFVLREPKDLEAIRASKIREIVIDVSKGSDVGPVSARPGQPTAGVAAAAADPAKQVAVKPAASAGKNRKAATAIEAPAESSSVAAAYSSVEPVPLREEVERAARICAKSKEAVESMFHEARLGRAVDTEAARVLVDEISNSVARNAGALISLARLKTADDYTYMHSVAVCALMVALARQLNLDEAQTRSAGLAGLLHDLGKARMPLEVLNKPGKLTTEEFAIMKKHPGEGHQMLLASGQTDAIALDVCLHHHEKMNGSGYPDGLAGEQISLLARMGAVCDVYDAITSNRPYKAGWDPAESLHKMAEWCDGHFDRAIFQAFVKSLGVYPVGSLVRLSSGFLGVVVEQTNRSLLLPQVKVFFSVKPEIRVPPRLLDLSLPGCKDKIVAREDPAKWKFADLNTLWAGQQPAFA